MKKLLLILLFICVIFSSCQSNDDRVQDDESFESGESSSISENISDESESDTTINNLCDLSYDEYFSKEYPYVYHRPASQKNYIFNIKEGYLVRYPQGKKYYELTGRELKFLYPPTVLSYSFCSDGIFLSTDKLEIIKINFDGTERELILDMNSLESEPITDFFAMDELIWFHCGNSIYRLHLSSNTLDKVYSNENLAWFKPISNYSVVCDIYTEKWLEYIENGGDPDEQVLFHMTEKYIYNSATDDFYEPQYYDDDPYTIKYEIEEDKNEN